MEKSLMSALAKSKIKRPDLRPQWKNSPGAALAERLRQFETVCVVKLSLARRFGSSRAGRAKWASGKNINEIGRDLFGLRDTQIKYCHGRAHNFLDDVDELARYRGRRGLPIDSDAMLRVIMERKAAA
jgi:hypothetical protein